ncbi:engrailed homeobox [Planoprotostelium fungivorum]|uniref:Engrailed homeobox n=1 Tax=Planoprotostelium fungivorum TaxID=1890364 RepID=A0A2P6NMY0_9EUKA|nr:engrailed homeobox [Planoprotostelium fungivorum]
MDVKRLIHEGSPRMKKSNGGMIFSDHVFFFTTSSAHRGRVFSEEQREKLLRQFESDPYPDQQRRRELAEELSTNARPIGMRSIQIWFQNKRQRECK